MKKVIIIFSVLAIIVCVGHYKAFPEETACILVPFKGFKKIGNIYMSPHASEKEGLQMTALTEYAEKRNVGLWGDLKASPTYIYCTSEEEYLEFGGPDLAPASARGKLGGYIVVNNKIGLNLDILSHERSHIELYERLGFFNYNFDVPAWFNEGLAMQVDGRSYYGEEALLSIIGDKNNLPKVEHLVSYTDFAGNSKEENRMNYMASKEKVAQWLKNHDIAVFIQQMKEGKSFEEAYNANPENQVD